MHNWLMKNPDLLDIESTAMEFRLCAFLCMQRGLNHRNARQIRAAVKTVLNSNFSKVWASGKETKDGGWSKPRVGTGSNTTEIPSDNSERLLIKKAKQVKMHFSWQPRALEECSFSKWEIHEHGLSPLPDIKKIECCSRHVPQSCDFFLEWCTEQHQTPGLRTSLRWTQSMGKTSKQLSPFLPGQQRGCVPL